MADSSGSSSGAGMGVIAGVLLVLVVGLVAFFAFDSGVMDGATRKVDANVSAPSQPAPK